MQQMLDYECAVCGHLIILAGNANGEVNWSWELHPSVPVRTVVAQECMVVKEADK